MKIETTKTIKESTYFNSVRWVKVDDLIEHITETKKENQKLTILKRTQLTIKRYYDLLEELK